MRNEATETTAIITSIFGKGIAVAGLIVGITPNVLEQHEGAIQDDWRPYPRHEPAVHRREHRLQHVETRTDDTNKRTDTIARDIAELRDQTGPWRRPPRS